MTIMLTPDEIPKFWEAIKFAAVNGDFVEEQYRLKYLNKLLYQLLSSKAQCFVRLSSERKLQMVGITKIMTDEVRDERTLFISSLYSFEKVDDSIWLNDFEFVKRFAKASNCKSITTWTMSERVSKICEQVGMKSRFKSYVYGGV